jgi:hypothetical protein
MLYSTAGWSPSIPSLTGRQLLPAEGAEPEGEHGQVVDRDTYLTRHVAIRRLELARPGDAVASRCPAHRHSQPDRSFVPPVRYVLSLVLVSSRSYLTHTHVRHVRSRSATYEYMRSGGFPPTQRQPPLHVRPGLRPGPPNLQTRASAPRTTTRASTRLEESTRSAELRAHVTDDRFLHCLPPLRPSPEPCLTVDY